MPQESPWEYDPPVSSGQTAAGSNPWEADPVAQPQQRVEPRLVRDWTSYLDRQNRIYAAENTRRPDYQEMLSRTAEMRAMNGEEPPREAGRSESFTRGVGDVFSAGFADEAAGAVAGLGTRAANVFRSESRRQNPDDVAFQVRERARAQNSQAFADNPVTYSGGGVVGGVAQTAGAAALAPARVSQGVQAIARSRPVLAGAAVGGLEGAAYGAGSSQGSLGDRGQGAALGGATGAALGGAIPGVARAGRSAAREIGSLANEAGGALRTRGVSTPQLQELTAATRAAYQAVDDAGASYSRRALARLSRDIASRADEMNLNPRLTPKAAAVVEEIQGLRARDMSLTELDQLRQSVRRDLMGSTEGGERAFGGMIIDQIDNMIDRATPTMANGTPDQASELIRAARRASRTQRASEALDDAIETARDRAASSGTGGNELNAIRQNLRRLITNQRTRRLFTAEQTEQIRRAVRGDGLENVLRMVGRFSPDSGMLSAAAGIGATAGLGPVGAILPAAGYVGKKAAEGLQGARVNQIVRNVRGIN
jgi:hypothetical protein